MHGKFFRVDAIIHAGAVGGGQINDKMPLTGLAFFWYNPKAADMQIRQWGGSKGAHHPMESDLIIAR